jgi:membrane protease subunit HflK
MKFISLFSKSPWDIPKSDFFQNASKKKSQFNFDDFGNFNQIPISRILLGLLAFWMLSGVYKVDEGSQAAITRFGKFVRIAPPGLSYHLPRPIEQATIVRVDESRRTEIGYRSGPKVKQQRSETSSQVLPEESIMLTGDENIIDLNCDIVWKIKDLSHYLFNIENIENTVKIVTESAIREVVGKTPISDVLSSQKQEVGRQVKELTQETLDLYHSGVHVAEVLLLKAEPPVEVIDAYRDVQTSRADKEREINQAYAYRNDLLPKARGDAARISEEAEGYKQEVIARAEGEAKRFSGLLAEYEANKQITKDRLHLDALEHILKHSKKIIVGKDQILPHMSLNNSGGSRAE